MDRWMDVIPCYGRWTKKVIDSLDKTAVSFKNIGGDLRRRGGGALGLIWCLRGARTKGGAEGEMVAVSMLHELGNLPFYLAYYIPAADG
jgi:hypothetical protein